MKETLIIIGAGGHGKVCGDIALKTDRYPEICFLDDYAEGLVMNLPIVGKISDYSKWIDEADFFVAIGNSRIREKYLTMLKEAGASIAILIHPRCMLGARVTLGEGTAVMAGAVINPDARIGEGVIINTAASVDHDNVIGDYCHISVGSHLAGTVEIGEHTMIGAGATVINNVKICSNCMLGAGAVVVKDIEEQGTYVGVPARKLI